MLIAIVEFHVNEDEHSTSLAALQSETETVRAMPGCRRFMPFTNPEDPTFLGVLHEWDSQETMGGYLSSPGFAHISKVLTPVMQGAPVSRRFEAQLLATPT